MSDMFQNGKRCGRLLAAPGVTAETQGQHSVTQASSTYSDLTDMHSQEGPDTEDEWDCGASEGEVGEVLTTDNRPASISVESRQAGSLLAEDLEIPATELTLQESVGTGCTAEVFKAIWRGHIVAVKEMREVSTAGHRERVAFHRELGILAKVNHVNLVRLHAVSFAARPWRIVTEFCSGGTLFELLHEGDTDFEPSMAQSIDMCRDIARGMDYLHKFPPPIIHRDLKSLNLLLAQPVTSHRDPVTIKVSDFGLARVMPTAPGGAGTARMTPGAGTLNWMAPEVASGGYYDEKADVYSYAMVIYEIICLEIPFEDEDHSQIAELVTQGIRPHLDAVPPDCPRYLAQVMINCWAHQPRERPAFEIVTSILESAAATLPNCRPRASVT